MCRNLQSGRDFRGASHSSKRRAGGVQQLTVWKGFHRRKSLKQTEGRRSAATYSLEGIS